MDLKIFYVMTKTYVPILEGYTLNIYQSNNNTRKHLKGTPKLDNSGTRYYEIL